MRKKVLRNFLNFFEVSGKLHSAKKCKRGTVWGFLKVNSVAKYKIIEEGPF